MSVVPFRLMARSGTTSSVMGGVSFLSRRRVFVLVWAGVRIGSLRVPFVLGMDTGSSTNSSSRVGSSTNSSSRARTCRRARESWFFSLLTSLQSYQLPSTL